MSTEDKRPVVQYSPDKLARLKSAYADAVRAGADSFTFEGNEYVRDYAKYLILYLDSCFAGGVRTTPDPANN